MDPKNLLERLSSKEGLEAVQRELSLRRQGPDGKLHPFYTWRPGTERFREEATTPYLREGNLMFQEVLPHSTSFLMGIVTANGTGKTEFGCHYTVSRAKGQHPVFPELTWNVPQRIRIGCEARLIDALLKRVVEMCPPQDIARIYWGKGPLQGIEFKNGSEIRMMSYDLPREAWQSLELDLIWFDEEPPKAILDEAFARMRKEGSQILFSFTGVNGTIYSHDLFEGFRESDYLALEGDICWGRSKMDENPFLPQSHIDREKRRYRHDPDMYAIRIDGDYRVLRGRHIFKDVLEEVESTIRRPHDHIIFDRWGRIEHADVAFSWAIWEHPSPHAHYVIGADLAEGGLEGDYTAAFVLNVDTGVVAARYHGKVEPGPFGRELYWVGRRYNTALINWELNMQGAAVWDRLKEMGYPRLALQKNATGKIRTEMQAHGFRTGPHNKQRIIENLRDALGDGLIQVRDELVVQELANFGYLRKEEASAKTHGLAALSGHDDLVMALAITWFTARDGGRPDVIRSYEDENFGDALERETLKGLNGGRKSRIQPFFGLI